MALKTANYQGLSKSLKRLSSLLLLPQARSPSTGWSAAPFRGVQQWPPRSGQPCETGKAPFSIRGVLIRRAFVSFRRNPRTRQIWTTRRPSNFLSPCRCRNRCYENYLCGGNVWKLHKGNIRRRFEFGCSADCPASGQGLLTIAGSYERVAIDNRHVGRWTTLIIYPRRTYLYGDSYRRAEFIKIHSMPCCHCLSKFIVVQKEIGWEVLVWFQNVHRMIHYYRIILKDIFLLWTESLFRY